jgi:hypothetical protein
MKKSTTTLSIMLMMVLSLLLAACSAREKGGKPSADWSRSLALGDAVVGSIGIAVDGTGERVHLAWPFDEGEGVRIRYMQLNQQAVPVVTSDLVFPGLLRAPRIVSTGDGTVHLFWASRVPGDPGWELWHTLLDAKGGAIGESIRLSLGGDDVGTYEVAADNAGGAVVAWVPRGGGELKLLHLDQSGAIRSGPILVATQVDSPSLRVDDSGNVHLAWLAGTSFTYAEIPLADLRPDDGRTVVDLVIGTGDGVVGPVLGIADGYVYILWSILKQSGLAAGTADTEFVTFPYGEPRISQPSSIWITAEEEQPYLPYQGSLALTQLVDPPGVAWEATDFILHPSAMMGSNAELAVALTTNQQFRLDNHLQIAISVFEDGGIKGYSFASKTEQISDDPVLFVDSAGYLYVAWREGNRGGKIYYATTEPTTRGSLDSLNAGDFLTAILQGGMESLVSIAFMPFVGMGWLLPGFLVIGIWKLYKIHESVTEPSSWPVLIIAMIIYFMMKIITLPTIVTYIPFSAWIYIPAAIATLLRIGMPLLILGIAFFVANKVRTRYSDSTLVFYIALAGIDAVLTLAVYGVNFLGVF